MVPFLRIGFCRSYLYCYPLAVNECVLREAAGVKEAVMQECRKGLDECRGLSSDRHAHFGSHSLIYLGCLHNTEFTMRSEVLFLTNVLALYLSWLSSVPAIFGKHHGRPYFA